MNETILPVGHGSRAANGNREIEQFAQLSRERQPAWRIEVCFIEFAKVLLGRSDRVLSQEDGVTVRPR